MGNGSRSAAELERRGVGSWPTRIWHSAQWSLRDRIDVLLKRRDPQVPPARLILDGETGHQYLRTGEVYRQLLVEHAGLQPHHRVLEVGSGIGKTATPLTRFLRGGSYDGFDINRAQVAWCARNISRRHPTFRFHLANIHNEYYNPAGTQTASTFRFPFDDGSFDFVVLTSVFTHMLPADVGHYLAEIDRVSAAGARSFITWFLLNPESLAGIAGGASSFGFPYEHDGCRVHDPAIPEQVIAYDEQRVRDLYHRHGLQIQEPVRYGYWSGRQTFVAFQDFVVALKPPPTRS